MYDVHCQAVSVKHMQNGDVKRKHGHESNKFLAYMRDNPIIIGHHLFIGFFGFSVIVVGFHLDWHNNFFPTNYDCVYCFFNLT